MKDKIIKKYRLGDLNNLGHAARHPNYWDKLRASLKEGYRPTEFRSGYIVIDPNRGNRIVDGNHRFFLLKQLYGDDYEVDVDITGIHYFI